MSRFAGTPGRSNMEDIRPYRIRNEENDRRSSKDAENRTEWELTQREKASEDDEPFHIPRD